MIMICKKNVRFKKDGKSIVQGKILRRTTSSNVSCRVSHDMTSPNLDRKIRFLTSKPLPLFPLVSVKSALPFLRAADVRIRARPNTKKDRELESKKSQTKTKEYGSSGYECKISGPRSVQRGQNRVNKIISKI